MKHFITNALAILTFVTLTHPCAAGSFQSDSKRFGNPKMDIVMTEVEQGRRTSVVDIKVNKIGSSVGSSFFILCSLRELAKQRGGFHHIVKVEETPRLGQMLVGFLKSADEPPESVDTRFAGAKVIDLEQFSPICDNMK